MALVTGTYVTSDGNPLPTGTVPQIEAIPSKPAITINGEAVSVKPQTVTPDPITGAFTFDLIPTVEVLDAGFFYHVRGYYLSPDGYGTGGFTRHELFDHLLYVPTEGGSIGGLAANGRPFEAWVFADPDWTETNQPQVLIPGAYYLSADLADPDLGTGDLWKAVA